MEENLLRLEEFKKSIASFDRLLLKDAAVLYKEMLEEKNERIKASKREYIICGLLYKVYEHILYNKVELLKSSTYDMDDIINSFIEEMIKRIDEGVLLKADSFGYFFNIDFFNDVFEAVTSKRIQIYDVLEIDTNMFAYLFKEYCDLKMVKPNATLEMIFDLPDFPYFMGQFKNIPYMQVIFDRMLNSLLNSDEDYLDLAPDKIKRFAQILLKNALSDGLINIENVSYSNFEDAMLQRMFENGALDVVNTKSGLTELQKDVINRYYIEGYSLEEIANDLHLTSNQSRGNVASALAKIRKERKVKRYVSNMPLGI